MGKDTVILCCRHSYYLSQTTFLMSVQARSPLICCDCEFLKEGEGEGVRGRGREDKEHARHGLYIPKEDLS